jgi:hypothetical protein
VQWEYRKILLNEHHRREDDLDLLWDTGEGGWELILITPNIRSVQFPKSRPSRP